MTAYSFGLTDSPVCFNMWNVGVDSVMKLDLKLELSSSGIFSEQKSLRLICQIDGKLPDDTISFLSW